MNRGMLDEEERKQWHEKMRIKGVVNHGYLSNVLYKYEREYFAF